MKKVEEFVPTASIETIKKKIKKLNKKAAKHGLEPFELEITDVYKKSRVSETNTISLVRVIVSGPEIKIGNYEILASFFERGNQIFTSIYDESIEQKVDDIKCEHCGIKRKRKRSFLLREIDTGETKEVGSTCLQEYTGINPKHALWLSNFYSDGFKIDIDSMAPEFDLIDVMELSAAVIEKYGWVSKYDEMYGDAKQVSTAFQVSCYLETPESYAPLEITEEHKDLVDRAFSHFMYTEEINAYIYNIQQLFLCGTVTTENLGLAASIVPSFQSHLKKVEREEAMKKLPKSDFVGVVKDKIELPMTITFIRDIEGRFGWFELVKFRDEVGNIFTWFNSGKPLDEKFELDKKYSVRGTIKKHEEYDGEKITYLSRVKVSELEF